MRQTPAQKARALADALHVELEVDQCRDYFDADMWAPKGFLFVENGCHCSVVNVDARYEEMPTPAELWGAVVERLSEGLEPCTETDCPYCTE
jgi:hypothetical protein